MMKRWLIQFLAPVITRHVAQFLGGALIASGFFQGQENNVRALVLQVVGGLVSAASVAWAGREATPAAVLTKATELPEVVKDGRTRIVVNDLKLATRTPTEVVYGQDMSIQ